MKLEEKDFDDIKNVILSALNSDELSKGREELEKECWDHIGDSGVRCVDYLIEKRNTILKGNEKENN